VEKFPEFYDAYNAVQYYDWLPPQTGKSELRQQGPTPDGGRKMLWDCTGPISYRGQAAVAQDIENFKAALTNVKVAEAFLPVAAPMSARGLWINSYYPNEDAVATALADALREEYRSIVDAGFLIQLDDAFLAHEYDRLLGDRENHHGHSNMRMARALAVVALGFGFAACLSAAAALARPPTVTFSPGYDARLAEFPAKTLDVTVLLAELLHSPPAASGAAGEETTAIATDAVKSRATRGSPVRGYHHQRRQPQ
jgi:hypothetical protein